jgi:cell division protein FtsA
MKTNRPVIAGLDIGSTKVSVVIGVSNSEGQLEIVGVGTSPNTGIRQGVVVNIEATSESILKAREEAELMSGYKISEVYVGVSGSHIQSFDSKGMVAIKNKEVTAQDVNRVIEAGKAVVVPTDRTVLHVIPREFKVDNQDGILDPIGMSGIRLEANVHIVTGGSTAIANNLKCIEKAGLKVKGLVLDPLASSMAVLSEDEKNLGVCVIDMGGGSCNLLYIVNGSVAHTSMVPVGGTHFTHDVAVGLRTPQLAAEDLKKRFGCALASLIPEEEVMEVEGVGGRKSRTVLRREIAEVLEPRAEETLQLVHQDLIASGLLPLMGSGLVFTGGASQLEGLLEMGEFIFDVPVRKGVPGKVGGLVDVIKSPAFATSVGLLLYAWEQNKHLMTASNAGEAASVGKTAIKRLKNLFDYLF